MTYSEETLDHLAQGDFTKANETLELALTRDEDDMLYSLAEELYSLGFSEMAAKAYETLVKRYPNEDSLKTALAEIQIGEGNDDQALAILSQITPESNAYLEALLVSADLYQTQGAFDVSEQKLLTAYRLAPDEPVIEFALAELYFNIKEYRKAAQFYRSLLKQGILEFSRVNLVARLGLSYAGYGKFETALGYLEQIPEEQLDNDTLFQLAFTQRELGDLEAATANFEKLRERTPDYVTVYPYLADLYEQAGQFGQALITAQEGLAVDEFNEALYQKASRLAAKLGKNKEATDYLKEALALDPSNLTLVLELSNQLLATQQDQENIELLKDYLAKDEVDPQIYWNLGRSYANLDDYEQALTNYETAARYLDDNAEFLRDAAFFFRNAGRRTEASAAAKAYLMQVPTDYEVEDLLDELQY